MEMEMEEPEERPTIEGFLVDLATIEGEFMRNCASRTPTTRRLDGQVIRLLSQGRLLLANYPTDPKARDAVARATLLHEDWMLWKAAGYLRGLSQPPTEGQTSYYILIALRSRYGEEARELLPDTIRALNQYDGQSRPSEHVRQFLGRVPAPIASSPIMEADFVAIVMGVLRRSHRDWSAVDRGRLLATWRLFNVNEPLPPERGSAKTLGDVARVGAKLLGAEGRPLLLRLDGKTVKEAAATEHIAPSTLSEKIPRLVSLTYRAFFGDKKPKSSGR